MPKTIRRALYRKLKELPELEEFQRDFWLMSGMKVAFLDELGLGEDLDTSTSPMCQAMLSSHEGHMMCVRSRNALLAQAGEKPCCMTCDAGLCESVVPLKIGGILAGYFVFGGVRAAPSTPPAIHRTAHLLRKHGVHLDEGHVEEYLAGTKEVPLATMDACQRMVHRFVRQLALKLTDQLAEPDTSMPPPVVKACRYIRSHGLVDDINLSDVARHCGVSEGHLSRSFHHSTGLTFREYLTQLRVDHARDLLLRTKKTVSEIAYDSGFQSLSQFHRVFLKAFGIPPGRLREQEAWPNAGKSLPPAG